jgi:hypothetical protein
MLGQAFKTFAPLTPPRTNYFIINADGSVAGSSNGIVNCSFYGPNAGLATGDLPAGNDWVSKYQRTGAVEYLYHREGYGRYKWEQYDLNGKLTSSSLMDKIVNQACPTPVQRIW